MPSENEASANAADARQVENEKKFVVTFVQWLRECAARPSASPDQVEALEVAIQTLESGFSLCDADFAFQPSRPLLDVFVETEQLDKQPAGESTGEPSDDDKAKAEALKNEGNDLMRSGDAQSAIAKYTAAIRLHRHPVFFCNLAAAHSKLSQHEIAVQNCRTAIALDQSYGKAYGRMGLALSAQNRYEEAVSAYKTALELEPTNESYKNNLDVAEAKAREQRRQQQEQQGGANPFASLMGGGGAQGGPDMMSFLNNPAMMNMASQVLSNPQMQNAFVGMSQMMASMMSGAPPGGAAAGAGPGVGAQPAAPSAPPPAAEPTDAQQPNAQPQPAAGPAGAPPNFANLLQVGQQLAEQMSQANPELVEQLRRQFQGTGPGSGSGNPPPGSV